MTKDINELRKELNAKKREIELLNDAIDEYDSYVYALTSKHHELQKEYFNLLNSKAWKITEPIRRVLDLLKSNKRNNENISNTDQEGRYDKWITNIEQNAIKECFAYHPLMSVVITAGNSNKRMLMECIESVRKQTYGNWEIILIDSCLSSDAIMEASPINHDIARIKIIRNGDINQGIKEAKGEYVLMLAGSDILSTNALQEAVREINNNINLKLIYSDCDLLSEDGLIKKAPFFKPDYSPDLLFWHNYMAHLCIYKKETMEIVGEFAEEWGAAKDYDYVLRFVEAIKAEDICHIEKVLYHQRKEEMSFGDEDIKADQIIELSLKRRNIKGHIEYADGNRHLVYDDIRSKVSIIIPSKDNYEVLRRCIDSLIRVTKYDDYEIIVVDNGSNESNKAIIEKYLEENGASYLYSTESFNFSKMCNDGAGIAKGDVLVFLNDDTEIIEPEWLMKMAGQARQKHTGAVGAKLYYPASTKIQHCGIGCLLIGPVNYLQGLDDSNIYYYGRNRADYNVLAVSAACLAVERGKFGEVGGFNEELPNNYNDVDFCLRLSSAGYYNIIRNDVKLYHYESLSRDISNSSMMFSDLKHLKQLNPAYKIRDPFHNRNLSQFSSDFVFDKTN